MVGMILSGLTIAVLPWVDSMPAWFGFRFLNGVAAAMSLIPVETRVNRAATSGQRARHFGYYAFSVALGWAMGNFVGLAMYGDTPRAAFRVGGAVSVIAGLIVLGWMPSFAERVEGSDERGPVGLGRNFLSFGSAWCQGFLEGGMVAFMCVYLLFMGLSSESVGWLTSSIMIGAILFQVPVAWLADRMGRTPVLLACYGVTVTGLLFLSICADSLWLRLWLFLVGACSGAFYPLGLAILGEKLPGPRLARANAWFLGINCCGSLFGPVITGAAMDYFGKPAMFAVAAAAVVGILIIWIATQRRDYARNDGVAAPDVHAVEIREAA